jgi:hypothetical protein
VKPGKTQVEEVDFAMGLSMYGEKGALLPALTCDKCGGRIKDWGLAVATYQWVPENSITVVKLYHKGQCDPGRLKGGSVLWIELKDYIPWLLWHNNRGIKQTTMEGSTITLKVPKPLDI